MDTFIGVAPILSNTTGNCMTTANWHATGTKVAAFNLAHLLMKPGYDFLMSLPNLASYVNWSETLILNATLPSKNSDKLFTLYSDYDGRRLQFSHDQIFALIAQLHPDIVVFSKGMWKSDNPVCRALPKKILPFLPESELSMVDRLHGVVFSSDMISERKKYLDLLCYVQGEFDIEKIQAWVQQGVQIIESNIAADDACKGIVYCDEGSISILDDVYMLQYETLAKDCQCPTCQQQLTRAYFHHLYLHTPHLCQRFIAEHNAYFLNQKLNDEITR